VLDFDVGSDVAPHRAPADRRISSISAAKSWVIEALVVLENRKFA